MGNGELPHCRRHNNYSKGSGIIEPACFIGNGGVGRSPKRLFLLHMWFGSLFTKVDPVMFLVNEGSFD